MAEQHVYQEGEQYYLVEIYEGQVTLKIKHHGYSDIWSLPIKEITERY